MRTPSPDRPEGGADPLSEIELSLTFQWARNDQNQTQARSLICSQRVIQLMQPLTQYGLMAEKHWRQFRPRMVRELEARGTLHEMLLEAEEKTDQELDSIRRKLIQQGLTPQQAHDQAWEMVRERYILLPAEDEASDTQNQ